MQNQLKRMGLAVPTLVLAVSTLVAVPVFAQDGSGDSGGATVSNNSGSANDSSGSGSSSGGSSEAGTQTSGSTGATDETGTQLRGRGAEMLQELRQQHKSQQSDSNRQKACEAHKQGLTTKFSHIVTNSQNAQTRITDILNKVIAYQKAKNLTVTNLDALVAAAQTAGQTSADSITTLKTVTPSLDCNNVSVAQDVATFKAAAQQTRTDLKAYKTAVKAVLVAVEQAKDSTGGSN